VSTTAAAYVRELSSSMPDRYEGDCAAHARRIAELLLADGRAPWIGRIRRVETRGDALFTAPLIPLRYLGRSALAWTTHYVACAGSEAYDPLIGEPIDVAAYAEAVFGMPFSIETHLDETETKRRLASGSCSANEFISVRAVRQ